MENRTIAERNSDDALANERSHNALAQLSVSVRARKDESAVVRRDRRARRIIDTIEGKTR